MAEKIIPRWEWRTFGQEFGEAEANIKKHELQSFRESEEVYILSKGSNENTKIRDDLMDIKSLVATNEDHLEQWKPIMKEGFPISVDKLEELYQIFKVEAPDFKRNEYTFDEFIEELVAPNGSLEAVDVKKVRSIYNIDECIVEIAETKFNEIPWRTICVEHIDPDLVMKVVKDLNMTHLENINYIKAMKQTVGM